MNRRSTRCRSPEVEVAILRSRCRGRVDVAYEYAVEHLLDAASRGLAAPELCAALGEPKPQASWEEALWLVADYASAGMRAAREMPPETR